MLPYEVCLFRPDGRLSMVMVASFASDRHAFTATERMMSSDLPSAVVSRDGRGSSEILRHAANPHAVYSQTAA